VGGRGTAGGLRGGRGRRGGQLQLALGFRL